MSYGILILQQDWADEFDVYGFMILDEERNDLYLKIKEENPEFFKEKRGWYFGTNEGFEDFQYKDIEYKEITKEEYDTLKKIFFTSPYSDSFGQFPYLFDDINDFYYNLVNKME